MNAQTVQALVALERRVQRLEISDVMRVCQSTANVSDPPTDAQLDAIFGTPANLGDGFLGVIDDMGAHIDFWLVATINGAWTYVQMTLAV